MPKKLNPVLGRIKRLKRAPKPFEGRPKKSIGSKTPPTRKMPTEKQKRFIEEYMVDFNASRAATVAGYAPNTAMVASRYVLENPCVSKEIAKRKKKLTDKCEITAERVLQEYARLAFVDLGDIMQWGPNGVVLESSKELTEDQRRAVAEVSETMTKDGSSTRVKLHDKKGALDALAKYLNLTPERYELTGRDGGPIDICSMSPDEQKERLQHLLKVINESSDDHNKPG